MATQAEERKEAKYTHLNSAHAFTPVAIETSGVFGAKIKRFVQKLGQRLERVTGEVRSTNFSHSEALCGSTTWKLSIGAGYNGLSREFVSFIVFTYFMYLSFLIFISFVSL